MLGMNYHCDKCNSFKNANSQKYDPSIKTKKEDSIIDTGCTGLCKTCNIFTTCPYHRGVLGNDTGVSGTSILQNEGFF